MDLAAFTNRYKSLLDHELYKLVEKLDAPSILKESMIYSLKAGGKRIRPLLLFATLAAFGQDPEKGLLAAAAIEMIHTYSLIHDDLPCMDDDDLRRGKPTNHKVFGEAVATLAGDALLTDAFALIARSAKQAGVPAELIVDTIAELAEACGSSGMVGGQAIDLLTEGQRLSQSELELLHGMKTGALFVAAVCGGARLGGAGPAQLRALHNYGSALGLAFQVTDDLLDVVQTTDHLGKRSQKDQERGKATYPSILGVEEARLRAQQLAQQAREALTSFDSRADPLRMLAQFAVERSL